jgi:hypothetical protein
MNAREAYQEKMEAQLDRWNAEIAKLQARADEAKAQAKIEYLEQIAQLRQRQDKARRKLDEMKKAGDGAWQDLKAGLELAWDDLSSALESAASRFKESS